VLNAQDQKPQYIGTAKCKICHMSSKKGAQFKKWQESSHAKAFETLASEQSKEIAKKLGIETDPQQSPECLVCHVTAFKASAEEKAASFKAEDGVGCESCHGPGSLYKSMKVMKALRAGTEDAKAVAFKKGGKETCLECHNEKSPTYKPFKFEERWAEIAHPIPEKE
jgi:hypothetical protein